MTDAAQLLQRAVRPPTRGGEAPGCRFCVQTVWKKTCIPTSASTLLFFMRMTKNQILMNDCDHTTQHNTTLWSFQQSMWLIKWPLIGVLGH
jgi:hypothetical protein